VTRLPDWEVRLSAYIASVADRPHAYGQHDCFLHCMAAAEAVTGIDHAAPFRDRYSNAAEGAALLRDDGAGTLLRFIDARFPRKPIGMAGRGDIVMVGKTIGVCVGAQALFVGVDDGREGMVDMPRGTWAKAWAV
jgi:hypothetical protein